MSANFLTLGDYPLADTEKMVCITTLSKFAEYLFGPAQTSSSLHDCAEKVFNDYHYFKLVRKIINTEEVQDVCIDLSLFIPESTAPAKTEEDEDGNIFYLHPGDVREISAILSEHKLTVSHSIGLLALDEIADVELRITKHTDEENVDPVMIGGAFMLSDELAITDVYVSIQ